MNNNTNPLDAIVFRYKPEPSELIMILQDIQVEFGYIAPEAVEIVSSYLGLPQPQIYSIATFYNSFRLKPGGKHKIEVCEGTACHIRGASLLLDQLKDKLGICPGETTADQNFTLNSVHCVGACAMAPVLVIDGDYHGNVTSSGLNKLLRSYSSGEGRAVLKHDEETPAEFIGEKITSSEQFDTLRKRLIKTMINEEPELLVCAGTGCLAKGSYMVAEALKKQLELQNKHLPVNLLLKNVGCQGFCEKGPLVVLQPDNIFYCNVQPDDASEIISETVINKRTIDHLLYHDPDSSGSIKYYNKIPFFKGQQRIALRNLGIVDPLSLYDYIAKGGFAALIKTLNNMKPEEVIAEVEKSGLRGRGGGGFPTGKKWRSSAEVPSAIRYVICNGDEGDPGAFMDRSIMEGDPYSVIEGMIICAYAVGAEHGYIYVREEYPRALNHLNMAIEQCRLAGFLGPDICGKNFSFDIKINRGTGAFVCGESTALMQSIEGKAGEPRAKYTRSSQRGLYNKPTVLNNVETFTNIPVIINNGASWFLSTGTESSPGTKVFSVVGKVKNTGLVEVAMGITLRQIIFDVCGGMLNNKAFKAVQTGGPSGGCLPENKLDLPVDFDSLSREGSMMGSGGMIVMDEDTCMVDVARYFISFLASESCGKCAPCRLGLNKLHDILSRICSGNGEPEDLDRIITLLDLLDESSLCGLGKSASNPVRSTLKHFREEYLAHIIDKKCPAKVCRDLISYRITTDCTGCRRCARTCPAGAISGNKNEQHHIDQELCSRCGLCLQTCNFDAIIVEN